MKLSVIIITKNEAANIAACLKSVAFADEFIVVDSGSTDGTVELAQALARGSRSLRTGPASAPRRTARWTWRPATGCSPSTPTSASRRSWPRKSRRR